MELLLFFSVLPSYWVGSYFLHNNPGPAAPKKAVQEAVGFGVLALILAIALSMIFDYLFFSGRGLTSGNSLDVGFVNVLMHASIEEFVKFIPLALFIYHRPFFHENTDGIIYFSIVGLTFGSIETFLYSLGQGGLFVTVFRLFVGLFFHAALTSLVGLFLAKSKVYHSSKLPTVMALVAASILHALYNFGLFASDAGGSYIWLMSVLIALILNSLMFWEYYVAAEQDKLLNFSNYQSKPTVNQ